LLLNRTAAPVAPLIGLAQAQHAEAFPRQSHIRGRAHSAPPPQSNLVAVEINPRPKPLYVRLNSHIHEILLHKKGEQRENNGSVLQKSERYNTKMNQI
jgi:hypothetical protein